MGQSIIVESTPDSVVKLGPETSKGKERPDSRIAIVVWSATKVGNEGGEPFELQVDLTVSQIAHLVKLFFAEIVSPRNIFARFLERLLRKRWAVMSGSSAKRSFGGEEPWFPSYHSIPENIRLQ